MAKKGAMFQKQSIRVLKWINSGKIRVANTVSNIRLTASILYAEEAYKNGCHVLLSDDQGVKEYMGSKKMSEPQVVNPMIRSWISPSLKSSEKVDLIFLGEGGQSKVFRADNNKVIKLFKCPEANNFDKIRLLIAEGKKESCINKYVLFPQDIIHQNDKNVGVSTQYYDGLRLSQAMYSAKYGNGICSFLTTMPVILSELHVRDIVLADLNMDNIMIDKFGGFALIDVDSAQIENHLTSVWRSSSAFPSLVQDAYHGSLNSHFRSPNEDLFSFYIIIFELYIGIHPLFNQNEDPNFLKDEFVFYCPTGVPADAQQAWAELSIEQRNFFYKTFVEFDIPTLSEYNKVFLDSR